MKTSLYLGPILSCGILLLAGCGSAGVIIPVVPIVPIVPVNGSGLAFGGTVYAGPAATGQPVVGSSVQLYAAGTTGNGSKVTTLLATPVTTNATGNFSVVAGSYTCPATNSVLFVVATSGHVGVNAANSAISLVTSLGACSALATGASYTVNELTTVAAAYAFSPFSQNASASIFSPGASATNAAGITLAAATLGNLVNLASGNAPGAMFPATGTPPTAKLSSLANALNACVVSSGSGSTACSTLLSVGAGITNIYQAAASVARNPGSNISGAYNLTLASSAYAPVLSTAPPDWTLFVTYKGGGMNDPTAVSVDSTGRVWVANYFGVASLFTNTGTPVFPLGISGQGLGDSYGGAVDASDNFWVANEPDNRYGSRSSITLLSKNGTALANSPYTAGGISYPVSVAFDTMGTAWIVDFGDSNVTLLSANGTPQSGTAGYDGVQNGVGTFMFPVAVAVDGKRQGWVANQSGRAVTRVAADGSNFTPFIVGDGPSGVAVDANNNVWTANYSGNSVGLVSAAGTVLSGSTGYTGGGLDHPQGIAVDGNGMVWVANLRGQGLTELVGVGSSGTPGTVLSPAAGWGPDANTLVAFSIAIDAGGSMWVSAYGMNTLTQYIGLAAPVKTPLIGPVQVP